MSGETAENDSCIGGGDPALRGRGVDASAMPGDAAVMLAGKAADLFLGGAT